jgi:hypothetical protein
MFWIGGHHFIQAMEVVFQDLDASQKVKKPIIGWHWLAFELSFQHLEHKALETYESWLDWVMVQAKLLVVEQYYETTHGDHYSFQRKCNNLKATIPTPNQPNASS